MKEDPPESIEHARLGDVLKGLPYLVSAAEIALEKEALDENSQRKRKRSLG